MYDLKNLFFCRTYFVSHEKGDLECSCPANPGWNYILGEYSLYPISFFQNIYGWMYKFSVLLTDPSTTAPLYLNGSFAANP